MPQLAALLAPPYQRIPYLLQQQPGELKISKACPTVQLNMTNIQITNIILAASTYQLCKRLDTLTTTTKRKGEQQMKKRTGTN